MLCWGTDAPLYVLSMPPHTRPRPRRCLPAALRVHSLAHSGRGLSFPTFILELERAASLPLACLGGGEESGSTRIKALAQTHKASLK